MPVYVSENSIQLICDRCGRSREIEGKTGADINQAVSEGWESTPEGTGIFCSDCAAAAKSRH